MTGSPSAFPTRLGNQHHPLRVLIAHELNAVISETTLDLLDRSGRRIESAALRVPDRLD